MRLPAKSASHRRECVRSGSPADDDYIDEVLEATPLAIARIVARTPASAESPKRLSIIYVCVDGRPIACANRTGPP